MPGYADPPVNPSKLPAELFRKLVDEGLDRFEIAERVGLHERTVRRRGVALGIYSTSGVRRTPDERADRVRLLLDEGMPLNWAAEDVGISISAATRVARGVPDRAQNVLAWTDSWREIRRSSKMLDLHRQFAPHNAVGQ